MSYLISLDIPFTPVAAVRPKVTRWSTYYPGAYGEYLPTVREWLLSEWSNTPVTYPLGVSLTFYLPRPVSHYRAGRNAHLVKDSAPPYPHPDIDNFVKGALDVMSGSVYEDDRQVIRVTAQKMYCNNKGAGYTRALLSRYEPIS